MKATKSKRMHDVMPRDSLDKWVFVLVAILGNVGIVALKYFFSVPAYIVIGWSVLFLTLYVAYAWGTKRHKIEPETIGDNCYYLGFLFTLSSLAITLYQIHERVIIDTSSSDSRPDYIPEVISGFGIALSSTIIGVFLRVFFMQFRVDFVDNERRMRAEINKGFDEFKRTMSGILSQMKNFATESIQLASERDERIRKITEKYASDHWESLKSSADSMQTHMKEAFSNAVAQAVKGLSERFEENQKLQQNHMEQAIIGINSIKEKLLKQESDALGEIIENRRQIANQLEESRQLLDAHANSVKANSRAVQIAADVMEKKLVPSVEALVSNMNSGAESFSTIMIDTYPELARQALKEISAAINEASQRQQIQLADVQKKIQTANEFFLKNESEALENIQARKRKLLLELEESEKITISQIEAMKVNYRTVKNLADTMEKIIIPKLNYFNRIMGRFTSSQDTSNKGIDSRSGGEINRAQSSEGMLARLLSWMSRAGG